MPVPTAATIKKIPEGIIVPEMQVVKDQLAAIEGELKSIHSEIKRLDDKVDSLRNELKADIGRLDERLTFTNKRLDETLEIRERLAALEAKVGH
jgi:peptidoglycan hydrolase CwlO-like protein